MDSEAQRGRNGRKETRKWLLLFLVAVGAFVLCVRYSNAIVSLRSLVQFESSLSQDADAADFYKEACDTTLYPELCFYELSSSRNRPQTRFNLGSAATYRGLTISMMNIAISYQNNILDQIKALYSQSRKELIAGTADDLVRLQVPIGDCVYLMEVARDFIGDSLTELQKCESRCTEETVRDVQTWISAAMTDHTTCKDGIITSSSTTYSISSMMKEGERIHNLLSISLSFLLSHEHVQINHVSHVDQVAGTELQMFPSWMKESDQMIIQNPLAFVNVTVSADGKSQFLSIQDAVNNAPSKSKQIFVIHVKKGIYNEIVSIPQSATNIMFIGDGIGRTIITGSRNVVDGATTYNSATVAVTGNGFLAQDITFRNTAGAVKHQAVALRVQSDKAAFFRCSFEGFQDTLYTHSLRQFFRDCVVMGTVDFIFGNSAAVFQNCTLLARVPLAQQKNTYTAQGRTDPNQNTGLSFQRCTVDGTPELNAVIQNFPTFLGRPWQLYSRTVFLQSFEGSLIDPAGWLEWTGSFALSTLFYGEYKCEGPGSGAAKRVSWSTEITEPSIANKFTVNSFISGSSWLPATGFPFSGSLQVSGLSPQ